MDPGCNTRSRVTVPPTMAPMKAIVVDDEWLVRSELRELLSEFPDIEVVDEAANVNQAVEQIQKNRPDVLFLDVQMPGENGFDLLNRVDVQARVVFITAFDQYAIRAFDINAIDYLLKPVTRERLRKTIERLRQEDVPHRPPGRVAYNDVLSLNVGGALKFVKVSQVQCLLAEGNYTFMCTADGKKDLVTRSLREWETVLPKRQFVRIHRSTLINVDHVEKIEKCRNYTQRVYLKGMDTPFAMSRRLAFRYKRRLSP
jgi:two-component system LytT family response regulator